MALIRIIVTLVALMLMAAPGQAVRLTSLGVETHAEIPAVVPHWPVPQDKGQLFYIQRSTNANTIVYTARFDAKGNLHRKPGRVYWRRFNDAGERKPLKSIEHLAFGFRTRAHPTPGHLRVNLRPLPQLPFVLRQTAPFQAELIATIGGRPTRAVYAYVTVDETGVFPKITRLQIFGIDLETGQPKSETFRVHGGGVKF